MDASVSQYLRISEPGLSERWTALLGEALAPGPADGSALSQAGRRRVADLAGSNVARFVSQQLELGARAHGRFPDARIPFWTSKGLEQATPAVVADHRAHALAAGLGPDQLVWDASCGAGSDSIAALRQGLTVLATDLDPGSVRCAHANLKVAAEGTHGSPGGKIAGAALADLRQPPLDHATLRKSIVILDPDRRPGVGRGSGADRRERRPDRWSPSLPDAMALLEAARGGCVKLPPGLHLDSLNAPKEIRQEWISLDGELKELTVWSGPLGPRALKTASALRTSGRRATWSSDNRGATEGAFPQIQPVADLAPGQALVELDASLWQSGLAGSFAAAHGHAFIGEEAQGMFCVAPDPPAGLSALCRAWPILEVVRADRKRVRELLRSRGIGPITVKKRHHPRSSAELEALFRVAKGGSGSGSNQPHGLLAVFRAAGTSAAVLLGEELVGDEGFEPPTPSV
ncbi:MAG: hypothetical protein AAGG01_24580 [Planctomycetota bacterium]